jgi:UDP-N-acetylmuramoylalanine--D-glutamate ligase
MGVDAVSAGNIGQPPYDPSWLPATWTVLEVSSFQAVDLEAAPGIVVVTSLGVDHLDWHGTAEEYWRDKLSFTRAEGPHLTLLAHDAALLTQREQVGGTCEVREPLDHDLTTALGLLGRHSDSNVALALGATARALEVPVATVVTAAFAHASEFTPLPGRLTPVRTIGNVRYVDDGLATSVLPTIAALEVFATDDVALIVGGFDRGVDYAPLATALGARARSTTVVTLGDAGARIGTALAGLSSVRVVRASDMTDAIALARDAIAPRGVVVLSPAAPSFDAYANWEERSADFARVVASL